MERDIEFIKMMSANGADEFVWLQALRDLDAKLVEARERLRVAEDRIAALTVQKDGAYSERDRLVAALGKLALRVGGECWLGQHDAADTSWDEDWRNIVYVRFEETGQLSWHVHDSEAAWFMSWIYFDDETWDGHTTEEKYARLERLSALAPTSDAAPKEAR